MIDDWRLMIDYHLFCAVLLVVTKIEDDSCASLKRGKILLLSIKSSSMTNSSQNSDSSASSITMLILEINAAFVWAKSAAR